MPKQIQTQIPNPQGRIFQDLDIWTLGIPKGFCQIPAFSPGVFLFLSALASCSSSLPAQHSSADQLRPLEDMQVMVDINAPLCPWTHPTFIQVLLGVDR